MRSPALRRGFLSGLGAVGLLFVAAVPSRLALALRGWASLPVRVERALAGVTLDLSAVVLVLVPVVAALTFLAPLVVSGLRGPRWQRLGAMLASLPAGFVLWLLTVMAQEVKSERGAFPTMFDLAEGGGNASFVEGTLGFARYERVWFPALIGLLLAGGVLTWVLRRRVGEVLPWRPWAAGVLGGLGAGTGAVLVVALGLASLSNRYSAAALGDPLTGLVESTLDLLQHRGPATPRQLVLEAELPRELAATGARRLGWPPRGEGPLSVECGRHPYARPLDVEREPMPRDARGRELVRALRRASEALFADEGLGDTSVFFLSLEGFRADDVHALNPRAPRGLAPFVNGLYEAARAGGQGVLAASTLYQAGVRTAQGLGAFTCGVGTLPYNLSFIRDLHPFPLRCVPDVLGDAGFESAFFYGSDLSFDEMHHFLPAHRFGEVLGQEQFPREAPKGTWAAVTDFAVFDAAVARAAKARGPRFSWVMSLSNHSPFTPPEDLPAAVTARVEAALGEVPHRADADDRLRLLTYSYTDAAVERLFARLEAERLAERSLVLLAADHSTGHAYVWGAEATETDAQKAQIPFAVVVPEALRARARDRAGLEAALGEAQRLLEAAPLSQNDVPALVLALLWAHPAVKALPEAQRWHTLGGQVTSPWFEPGGEPGAAVLGINGVSELYALDRAGALVGGYEDSVFLKTRADRYRVTPRLIPVTVTLVDVMRADTSCAGAR